MVYMEEALDALFSENTSQDKNDKDDIYYNKHKYDSGQINLLFLTGYSGSGKSSMSKNITAESVDMDKLILPYGKDDEYYKSLGGFADFFMNKGEGKKFRERPAEDHITDDYRSSISKAAVSAAIKYAKSHSNVKLVVEGVWLYRYIEPSTVKDYAVFIKGTTLPTSAYRAINRDLDKFKDSKSVYGRSKPQFVFSKVKQAFVDAVNKGLKKWRDYYKPMYEQQLKVVHECTLENAYDFFIPYDDIILNALESSNVDVKDIYQEFDQSIMLALYESMDKKHITKEEFDYLRDIITN